AGNGTSTFNLPDLRRKVTAGAGGSSSATLLNTVGSTGGSETHVLSANEGKCEFGVSATFQQVQAGSTSSGFLGGLTITNKGNIDFTAGPTAPIATVTGTVGSAEADPHNIVQPTAIVRKLIKATA
ncbi:MAG: hypothetical protein EBY22_09925, partial [Gammaproteobacteria bacterium]|nr:hypothetical protein [Gammaproteobacteria bacterium]